MHDSGCVKKKQNKIRKDKLRKKRLYITVVM